MTMQARKTEKVKAPIDSTESVVTILRAAWVWQAPTWNLEWSFAPRGVQFHARCWKQDDEYLWSVRLLHKSTGIRVLSGTSTQLIWALAGAERVIDRFSA